MLIRTARLGKSAILTKALPSSVASWNSNGFAAEAWLGTSLEASASAVSAAQAARLECPCNVTFLIER